MLRLSKNELREHLDDTIDRVASGEDRVLVVHNEAGCLVAIVSMDDLRLLEAVEDRMDHEIIQASLAESDERIPWEDIKKGCGPLTGGLLD